MSIESQPPLFKEPSVNEKLGALLVEASDSEWYLSAACRNSGTDRFYYEDNERGGDKQQRDMTALDSCIGCPVRDLCIASSINRNETYGFWGASEAAREEAWELAAQDKKNPHLKGIPKKTLAYFHLLRAIMPDHPATQKPSTKVAYAR